MNLPEINFNRPVADDSRTSLIVDEARRKAFDVVMKGVSAFSAEFAKTQDDEANAEFAQGVSDIDNDLDANKTTSTEWVRKQLGGTLDALPPEIRAQVTAQALDMKTNEMVEADRSDIPGWVVAPYVFNARVEAALNKAAAKVSAGKQEEFKAGKAEAIASKRAKIASAALREGIEAFNVKQTQAAIQLASTGQFDEARGVVSKSRSMDAPYKEKLLSQIDKIEQVRPIYEAVQREDIGAMAELLGKLNDPGQFGTLEPSERTAFSERLKGEIRDFQAKIKSSEDRELKLNADAGWRGIFEAVRTGRPVTYKDIPATGTIPPEEEKQMMAYVDARREGTPIKTNWSVYEDLRRKISAGEDVRVTAHRMSLADSELQDLINFSTAVRTGGSRYDNFISTEEAIESRLPKGFDKESRKKDEKKSAMVGHVYALVRDELSALGQNATPTQRDEAIDKVIRDNVKVEPGWIRDTVKVPTMGMGIPPKYVVALRRVASALGTTLDDDGLAATYKDFSYYEKDLLDAWGPQARGRRPDPDLLLGAYGYLKGRWGSIDAELRRAGRTLDNPNRAALAVQGFLANQR